MDRQSYINLSPQNIEYITANVVGIAFDSRSLDLSSRLFLGEIATLIRQPENQYDANAICVHFGSSLEQLGFIPKADAAYIAPRLDVGFSCGGYVRKIDERNGLPSIQLVIGLARPHITPQQLLDQLSEWKKRYLKV